MNIIVGIGDMAISSNKEDTIKTYALASCVGITAYDKIRKIGGMTHIALPSGNDVIGKPCYYASAGIDKLITKMVKEYKCSLNEMEIELFGGAMSINKKDIFQIGMKNLEYIINVL